jgi:hypothetical protein
MHGKVSLEPMPKSSQPVDDFVTTSAIPSAELTAIEVNCRATPWLPWLLRSRRRYFDQNR